MSIDRRIVSILYYNGITDVENVEKFIGEKDSYYEIIINGELKKLKIPGFNYTNKEFTSEEFLKSDEIDIVPVKVKKPKEKKIIENLEPLNNLESIAEKIEEETNELFTARVEIKTEEILENVKKLSFEEDLERTEKENEEILKSLETKKPKKPRVPKLSEKKIEIIESKKIDDDIDDFLTTI